jgi:toxin ParE1/3/4
LKRVHFTENAEDSLFEIAVWTLEHFGSRQADVYQRELVERCAGLARGDVPSQSCSVLIATDLAADMRFARVGAHVVVFVESKVEIVVMDFVHQREDLAGRVRGLVS